MAEIELMKTGLDSETSSMDSGANALGLDDLFSRDSASSFTASTLRQDEQELLWSSRLSTSEQYEPADSADLIRSFDTELDHFGNCIDPQQCLQQTLLEAPDEPRFDCWAQPIESLGPAHDVIDPCGLLSEYSSVYDQHWQRDVLIPWRELSTQSFSRLQYWEDIDYLQSQHVSLDEAEKSDTRVR